MMNLAQFWMQRGMWGFNPFMWLFGLFWLISIVFIIWAWIDIARADKDVGWKIIWAILTLFLGLIGVLLYYIIEFRERREKETTEGSRRSRLQARK
jgi:heme/copper-type cytochrome/quinol oxidase subunit 2